MRGSAWPQSAITALTDLWARGASAGQIAKRMGVSRNAVIGKAHRLNLPARRDVSDAWTDEDLAMLTALWPTNATVKTIAKHLRRTEGACKIRAVRLGLHRRSQ